MERLYETFKPSRGIDYRYWGFGQYKQYIGPKFDPSSIHQENVLKLLAYLDRQEENDLKLYKKDRQKLVKSLSEAYKIKYQELRKEKLQTRLWRREEELQKIKLRVRKHYQILIVDPSDEFINVYRNYQDVLNVDLIIARSFQEALEKYRELKPAEVIINTAFPAKEGYELVTRLKQLDKKARILVFIEPGSEQAKLDPEYFRGYLKSGAVGYIAKPIAPDTFLYIEESKTNRKTKNLDEIRGQTLNQDADFILAALISSELRNGPSTIQQIKRRVGKRSEKQIQESLKKLIDAGIIEKVKDKELYNLVGFSSAKTYKEDKIGRHLRKG